MTQRTFPPNSYHPIVAEYISKFKSGELTFEIIANQFPDKIETFDENNNIISYPYSDPSLSFVKYIWIQLLLILKTQLEMKITEFYIKKEK